MQLLLIFSWLHNLLFVAALMVLVSEHIRVFSDHISIRPQLDQVNRDSFFFVSAGCGKSPACFF